MSRLKNASAQLHLRCFSICLRTEATQAMLFRVFLCPPEARCTSMEWCACQSQNQNGNSATQLSVSVDPNNQQLRLQSSKTQTFHHFQAGLTTSTVKFYNLYFRPKSKGFQSSKFNGNEGSISKNRNIEYF